MYILYRIPIPRTRYTSRRPGYTLLADDQVGIYDGQFPAS